jgi:predicted ATPase
VGGVGWYGPCGTSSLFRGDITEGLAHYNLALALYDRDAHRALAARFAQDVRVATLSTRAFALWMLGYPSAARRDTDDALKEAADFGQSGTSMYALQHAGVTYALLRDAVSASTLIEQSISLAEEKNTIFWKSAGMLNKGWLFVMHGNIQQAIECLNDRIAQFKSTGSTMWMQLYFAQLALAHAGFDQFDLAWRNIDKSLAAIETTKEKCWEAEVCRIAGEIELKIANPDTAKAQEWFQRALATARAQQAKSWELRAAMSMARLWRDQGKWVEARDLLAPVYGWFTEGFDTLDLKEAKALLDALAS